MLSDGYQFCFPINSTYVSRAGVHDNLHCRLWVGRTVYEKNKKVSL